jgi:hypothetical protein
MTDEELVKWLRNEHRKYVAGTTVTTTGYSQASARIEALTAELKTVLDREAESYFRHDAKIEALTAKVQELREHLSGALETLRDAGVCDDKCSLCNEAFAALEKQP